MSKNLEKLSGQQMQKVYDMIDKDYQTTGKIAETTKIQGLWSGLLYLHGDAEVTLEFAFNSKDKMYLDTLKLMLQDEIKYVDSLLETT